MVKCLICNQELTEKILKRHCLNTHGLTIQEYYDRFFKKDHEEICLMYGQISSCKKFNKFRGINRGYSQFCSLKCSASCSETRKKYEKTCVEKYGVPNVFQNKQIKNKIKNTCLEKFGVKNPNQNEQIKNKKKNTCLIKYGVENPSQVEEIKLKKKNTSLEHYGIDHPLKCKKIIAKMQNTNLKRYGASVSSQNEQVKNKQKATVASKTFEQKIQKKQKTIATNLHKYGVSHCLQAPIIRQQIEETCFKKYGVNTPSRNNEVKTKIIKFQLNKQLPKVEVLLQNLKLQFLSPYKNAHEIIRVKCQICDLEFETVFFNLYQGCGRCPNCYPKYKSIAETEILNYIKSQSFNFNVFENNRNTISPLELDIYIPEKALALEYNGLYWHSETAGKDKNYHLNKLNLCQSKNITLIQIFEDEWFYHQDIVKYRLQQILGVNNSQRIHARSCIIKEISSNKKNEFLIKYHLQGFDNSPLSLGAFYNDILLAVMTFNHGSLAKGVKKKNDFNWELNRYCCDYNFHIPGIASKLLSYFKKNYKWKTIYSFADRRWSVGNMYYKLGFELESITKPNYWYVKGLKRIHRFALRKRPDEPKDTPEWLLRLQEGYTRIWDCGNLKFVIQHTPAH
jgi:hypothetical protein